MSDSDMSLVCSLHVGEAEKFLMRVVGIENRGLERSRRRLIFCREKLQAAEAIRVKVAIVIFLLPDKQLREMENVLISSPRRYLVG